MPVKSSHLLQSAAAVSLLTLLSAAQPARAAEDTAQLIVGDSAANHLYVYGLPGLRLLADFDGISVGGHAGTIPLADGRILIPDEVQKQLVVLKTGASCPPQIAARIPMPIPLGDRYGWTAVDPAGRYLLATSDDDDEATELLTIVDLENRSTRQLRVDVGGAEAEFGVSIGGDPVMVAFHLANRVDLYPLATLTAAGMELNDIVDGKLKPAASLEIGDGGHSDSVSMATGTWTGSTLRGLEIAHIGDGKFTDTKTLPWDIDGLTGGRNARQRLTTDGKFEFGPLNAIVPAEKWANTQNDLHWVDLAHETASRTPLAKGIVGRAGVSKRYAVYSSIQLEGDFANIVDVDPASKAFKQVVAQVPLDKLSHGPVVGNSPAKAEGRYTAISPDGNLAFVTHGGDGMISVIDTATGKVSDKIKTPTPLKGGGYIVATAPGMPISELSGR